MSKLSEMLYGELDSVDRLLEDECEPAEIRAAVQNILRHVQTLEKQSKAS